MASSRDCHSPSPTDIQKFWACGICLANIRARVVEGELRILCDGTETHDVAATGDIITKASRDYRLAQEEQAYHDIIGGLPKELQEVVKCQ